MNNIINLWEILVPTHFNNGEEIPVEYHKEWDHYVEKLTGGLTILKKSRGTWISNNGTKFQENMIPVRIACNADEINQIAIFTATHYEQEAVMYYLLSKEIFIYTPPKS